MKKSVLLLIILQCITAAAQSLIPENIKPGDKIAIITPASICKDVDIDSAASKLTEMGFSPVIMPNAYNGKYGSYPAPDSLRAADIMNAFTDPEIKAIICSRGGYGCNHLLPLLDAEIIRQNPKWLVGYSDISALHAFINHAGVASIHGPMAKNIAYADSTNYSINQLFSLLTGLQNYNIDRVGENSNSLCEYSIEIEPSEFNNAGIATGKIVGGNLMVTNALSETPWDIMHPFKSVVDDQNTEDIILFIEDVDEKIYAIERVLYRLHQSGILSKISGLIVGDFTDYEPDDNFETMEQMISKRLREWGYYDLGLPIAFGLHAGHGEINTPIILGARANLIITDKGAQINY